MFSIFRKKGVVPKTTPPAPAKKQTNRGDRLEAGRKTAITIRKRYGPDYYKRIGAMGGKKGRTGGFYANRELARTAGAKGGRNSKRGKAVK